MLPSLGRSRISGGTCVTALSRLDPQAHSYVSNHPPNRQFKPWCAQSIVHVVAETQLASKLGEMATSPNPPSRETRVFQAGGTIRFPARAIRFPRAVRKR